ncbi:MAG: hypothetical protein LBS60_12905 [Deltaproteobacteria bacterium]|jgi:hypothetical protein|nr:hypothetical protein [Deltaproteobacteria bacterium]
MYKIILVFLFVYLSQINVISFAVNKDFDINNAEKELNEVKELYYEVNCLKKNLKKSECPIYILDRATATAPFLDKVQEHAIRNYVEFFGGKNPTLKSADEITSLKDKAEKGDINSIFELYRYYKYPLSSEFSIFSTKANQVLLKAIKLGSEKAILEMGYDRPYAIKTRLNGENVSASIIANCEKFGRQNNDINCFLYRLEVKSGKNSHKWTIIVNEKYSYTQPYAISLLMESNNYVVKLSSLSKVTGAKRDDYFNFNGEYLGSTQNDSDPSYIFEFRNISKTFNNLKKENIKQQKIIESKLINKFPTYNMFAVQEDKRQIYAKSIVNPSFKSVDGFPDYGDLGGFYINDHLKVNSKKAPHDSLEREREPKDGSNQDPKDSPSQAPQDSLVSSANNANDSLNDKINEFTLKFGYHPNSMRNVLNHATLDHYLQKGLDGDLFAIKIIFDNIDNPLSFIHNSKFSEKLANFENALGGLFKLKDIEKNIKIKNLLNTKLPASNQDNINLDIVKNPYIAINKSKYNGTEIEIQFLCDSYNRNTYDEPIYLYEPVANCYAMRLRILNNTNKFVYFFVQESALEDTFFYDTVFVGHPRLNICPRENSSKGVMYFDDHKFHSILINKVFDLDGSVFLDHNSRNLFDQQFNSNNKDDNYSEDDHMELYDCVFNFLNTFPNWEDVYVDILD